MRSNAWLIVATLCGLLFGAITADVLYHGQLERFDHLLAAWLFPRTSPIPIFLASALTGLGDQTFTIPLALVLSAVLIRQRRWRPLALFLAACLLHIALVDTLKPLIGRPRPTAFTYWIFGRGYTYPSGHTMGAVLIYGTLAWLARDLFPRRRARLLLAAAAVLIPLLVGVSVLYLGVHYLTDVLAAWCLGAAVLILLLTLDARLRAAAQPPTPNAP